MAIKDLLIGAIHNLPLEETQVWYKSARASGFDGDIALMVYDEPPHVIDALGKDGILVVTPTVDQFNKPNRQHIHPRLGRFEINRIRYYDLWTVLLQSNYRYVVMTDVRDVVFQSNPFAWLENNMGNHELVVGSECITYGNSSFNSADATLNFGPYILEYLLKNAPVVCCGIIAGTMKAVRETALTMYLMAEGNPDYSEQASLNVMLNNGWNANVTTLDDGFIAHCAIPFDSRFEHEWKYLTSAKPIWKDDRLTKPDGTPYVIVHQYNRINGALEGYKKRYGI